MSIRKQTPPSLVGQPKASFDAPAFDALLWQQGYNVELAESRQCPCRSKASGSPLPTCSNCRGMGQVFINPIETKAIISSINKKGKYVEWSEETVGTFSITLMNINRLNDYDRITFLDVVSKKSEILKVRTVDGQMFVFLTYKPTEILDVFHFESSSLPLVKLSVSDYEITVENPYILKLDFVPPTGFNSVVTVTYNCNPSYHVIDIPHDLRSSTFYDSQGQLVKADLPIQAIVRKTHVVFGVVDYDGEIVDNSYL